MKAEHREQYDSPPVRRVELTVYFEPIRDLTVSILGEVQGLFRDGYPEIVQRPPVARDTPPLPESDPLSDADGPDVQNYWPLPAIRQISTSLNRRIEYQFDQFSLVWAISPNVSGSSGNYYPGFDILSADLIEEFSKFVDKFEMSERPIKVQGCGCRYRNNFDPVSGPDWALNFLSGDSNIKARVLDDNYFGIRRAKFDDNEALGTHRHVECQLDSIKGKSTVFLINSLSVLAGSHHEEGSDPSEPKGASSETQSALNAVKTLMQDAHSQLVDIFEDSVNETMRSRWRK